MIFLKKNRNLVGQNKYSDKKPQKQDANVQKNTTLYFQIGLILCLLTSYALLEMESTYYPSEVAINLKLEESIFIDEPITFKKEKVIKKEVIKKHKRIDFTKPIEEVPNIEDIIEDVIEEPTIDEVIEPHDVIVIEIPSEDVPVPFHGIQKAPIYPGCEKFSDESNRKRCFSDKVGRLVARKYNKNVIANSGLEGKQRVNVQFKVNKQGDIIDIKAQANDSDMEREAIKVIKKLPKMIPGQQNDKNVDVIYSLPIILQARQ